MRLTFWIACSTTNPTYVLKCTTPIHPDSPTTSLRSDSLGHLRFQKLLDHTPERRVQLDPRVRPSSTREENTTCGEYILYIPDYRCIHQARSLPDRTMAVAESTAATV
jgi:hypothetical protein